MKNEFYLVTLIALILIAISFATGCSTPVIVKKCDQTKSEYYWVCHTLGY